MNTTNKNCWVYSVVVFAASLLLAFQLGELAIIVQNKCKHIWQTALNSIQYTEKISRKFFDIYLQWFTLQFSPDRYIVRLENAWTNNGLFLSHVDFTIYTTMPKLKPPHSRIYPSKTNELGNKREKKKKKKIGRKYLEKRQEIRYYIPQNPL